MITIQEKTETPSSTPPNTLASIPTETPTASITPLPTIPTFTQTFDASTIVTVMPASKAECPKENPKVVAKFATPNSYGSYDFYGAYEILDYLNSGGILAPLATSPQARIMDLTADGLSEVVFSGIWRYDILVVQGHESNGGTVYNTLRQKYGGDLYGRPYVEMANAFWDVYKSTHKMYDGRAAAIQYAAEHPEIFSSGK